MSREKTIKYKTMTIEVEKAENDDDRQFSFLITNETVDRDHEVLLAQGLNKKEFMSNPVVLFNHNPDKVIGNALSLRRSGNGWKASTRIVKNVDYAEDVFQLLNQGVLRAVSVGFHVIEERSPTTLDIEKFGKSVRNIISKWELYEFSIVAIGSNPEALRKATKNMTITAKDILGDEYVDEEIREKEIVDAEIKDKKGETEKIENMVDDIEKDLEEKEIELNEETRDKIVEVIKTEEIDTLEVMKYFKIELYRQIRKSNGNLF